jgi:hypothetical protein
MQWIAGVFLESLQAESLGQAERSDTGLCCGAQDNMGRHTMPT